MNVIQLRQTDRERLSGKTGPHDKLELKWRKTRGTNIVHVVVAMNFILKP